MTSKKRLQGRLHGGGGRQIGEITRGGSRYPSCKRDQITVWHEIFAGAYFCGLAIFCVFCGN